MPTIYYELDAVDGDASLLVAVSQTCGETDALN